MVNMQNTFELSNYQHKLQKLFNNYRIGEKKLKRAEYRNSIRSRRLISDALLELLDEKPLEKITVTDITTRADVNRGTFYLHYSSVNEVISELQDAYISQMDQYFANLDISLNIDNIMIITAECLKYIYDQHQPRYLALLFHQQLSFADKVCRCLQERLLAAKDIPQDEDLQKELIVRASLLAHGVIGIFHASAAGMMDVSSEHLIRSVDNLVSDMHYLQTQKKKRKNTKSSIQNQNAK